MAKRALITGVTGQDGSYLAEFLLAKGYEVHGIIRRSSSFNTDRIEHLYRDPHSSEARLFLHYGDLMDPGSLRRLLLEAKPDEVYNLGAQSHVRVSFDQPAYTVEVVALGTLNLLEAVRSTCPHVRFYQASSSEMYGAADPPQNEETRFYPRSPYACAKVFAYHQVVNYREAYGLFAVNGTLFNHESPRRGETFVTRKITRAATRIKLGLQDKLYLGNLDAKRDWGYAGDYVEAMWMMLAAPKADDYVIATGEAYSVRRFCEMTFGELGLDWRQYVERDPRYERPSEVPHLLGDPSKAEKALGWKPRTSFKELVKMMVAADLQLAEREQLLVEAGHGNLPRHMSLVDGTNGAQVGDVSKSAVKDAS